MEHLVKKVKVRNEFGIHARPAARISQMAQTAAGNVWFKFNGEKVDAGSVIDILSLCCVQHSEIEIEIETPEDMNVLDEIIGYFKTGFGETEHE